MLKDFLLFCVISGSTQNNLISNINKNCSSCLPAQSSCIGSSEMPASTNHDCQVKNRGFYFKHEFVTYCSCLVTDCLE